jgi:hypothetical protein
LKKLQKYKKHLEKFKPKTYTYVLDILLAPFHKKLLRLDFEKYTLMFIEIKKNISKD